METKLYLFMLAVCLSVVDCYDLASFRDTLESKELNPATDSDDIISTGPVLSDSETDEERPVLINQQPDVRALRHPHVFAQVELTGNHIITPGHRVVFNQPIDSLGSAFSPATGVFRAPYEGTYLFSVELCTFTGNVWTFFHILKHGRRLTTGYLGDPNWGSCGSATAVTYMAAGSEVWVEAGKNNYGHTITISARHTFTGVLLNRN